MEKYVIVFKSANTGAEVVADVVNVHNLKEARVLAVARYYDKVDVTKTQIIVRRGQMA